MKSTLHKLWEKLETSFSKHSKIFGQYDSAEKSSDDAGKISKLVSVVIPALNEEKNIANIVAYAFSDPATAEVIVIDDCSTDKTAACAEQAGAKVITSKMLGKGVSMKEGAQYAKSHFIVYLDGDLTGLQDGIISRLSMPLIKKEADLVKARFGRSAGRVTELLAKPMLKVFFPELAQFSQPLGGIIAADKSLLQTLNFEDGYGVDVGLLIDSHLVGAKIIEVDIGLISHDSQPLNDLVLMANEVSRVIFNRAKHAGKLHVDQVAAMYEIQRQTLAEIEHIVSRRKGHKKLLLLDMDGTVSPSRFAIELAQATGRSHELMQFLDNKENDAATRSEQIAAIFRFLHKREFEKVASKMEIRPGVIEFVRRMKRAGFMVGIISDSYFVATEVIRRRLFADFAIGHMLTFNNDICTGELRINQAFLAEDKTGVEEICKSNVLRYFTDDTASPTIETVWAIGDNINDLQMLRKADYAFVIEPKSEIFADEPSITRITSFEELLDLVPETEENMTSHTDERLPQDYASDEDTKKALMV